MATNPIANDPAHPSDVPADEIVADSSGDVAQPKGGDVLTLASATDPESEVGNGSSPP